MVIYSNMEANLIRLSRISRISQILFRCIPPSIALSLFFVSHRSHRFTQIFSLQATVVTMPHSNRCFSAREFLIGFTEHELHELHEYVAQSLKIREIQEIRVQKSTLNIISQSLTDFKQLPSSLCLDMNRRLQEVEHL